MDRFPQPKDDCLAGKATLGWRYGRLTVLTWQAASNNTDARPIVCAKKLLLSIIHFLGGGPSATDLATLSTTTGPNCATMTAQLATAQCRPNGWSQAHSWLPRQIKSSCFQRFQLNAISSTGTRQFLLKYWPEGSWVLLNVAELP